MKKFETYFKKLNIQPKELSLDLVEQLQLKHLETFTFNNIAVLLNKPLDLNIDSLLEKIVTKNLGGYCFEHNKLMHDILKFLGFDVRILVARVINNIHEESPRTHRITLLSFKDKEYLVDVGFGALSPTRAIEIKENSTNEEYFIEKINKDDYKLIMLRKEKNFTLYTFNLVEYCEADCVMGNFYSEYHPDAVFRNNFVVSKQRDNKTLSFRNNIYHKSYTKETDIIKIENPKQLKDLLQNDFNITISTEEATLLFQKGEEFRRRTRKIL
jgi:N-hydroxyarylamine O-acetyltransferase